MIAATFLEEEMDRIIDVGVACVDPRSEIREIAADVRRWHAEHPDDWRATRRLVKEKYVRYAAEKKPDANGYALNTASVLAALLYGEGDFQGTMITAYNFGWDADCNAATAGTVVGVIKGYRWMQSQGWEIEDRYRNTTRDGMPDDETITGYADRIAALAERVILEQGGAKHRRDGRSVYTIAVGGLGSVEPLRGEEEGRAALRDAMKRDIEAALGGEPGGATGLARAAYLAICLDLAGPMSKDYPEAWPEALETLDEQKELLKALFNTPGPDGDRLRAKAVAAGLRRPE
jgi:hypothetical protein